MAGERESQDPAGRWQCRGQGSAGHQLGVPGIAGQRPVLRGAGGAQNRLKKISGGYEEYQVNGLKRTYEDTDGLLTGWTGQAGTWTVNRVNTRIESIVDPAGWRTTLIYDEEEYPTTPRLSEIIDSAGRQTLFEYDASGNRRRLLKVTSPEQCVTSFSYYGDDRLQAWTTPSGLTTTFSYTSGQLTGIQRPDGRVTITYAGNTLEIQDARGQRTTYVKDATNTGQLQVLVNPLGQRTTYSWESGWPRSIQDGRGHIYTFSYQSLSGDTNLKRLQGIEFPGGGRFTYLMDSSGQLTTITDERGNSSA